MTKEEITRIESIEKDLNLLARITQLEYLVDQKDKIIEDYRKMVEEILTPLNK